LIEGIKKGIRVKNRQRLVQKNLGFSERGDGESFRKNLGKTDRKRKILGAVCGVLFLTGWMGWSVDSGPNPTNGWAQEKKTEKAKANGGALGPMVKLKPLIVNLSDEGAVRYVKTSIVLEISQEEYLAEVKAWTPSILDMIISILCDKKLADLKAPQFKEGLKKELMEKSHQMLGLRKIKNIYFDEFIFQ
jgi:flagellar basal body-associated protein FliL